jgi:hypothetical protein
MQLMHTRINQKAPGCTEKKLKDQLEHEVLSPRKVWRIQDGIASCRRAA